MLHVYLMSTSNHTDWQVWPHIFASLEQSHESNWTVNGAYECMLFYDIIEHISFKYMNCVSTILYNEGFRCQF